MTRQGSAKTELNLSDVISDVSEALSEWEESSELHKHFAERLVWIVMGDRNVKKYLRNVEHE